MAWWCEIVYVVSWQASSVSADVIKIVGIRRSLILRSLLRVIVTRCLGSYAEEISLHGSWRVACTQWLTSTISWRVRSVYLGAAVGSRLLTGVMFIRSHFTQWSREVRWWSPNDWYCCRNTINSQLVLLSSLMALRTLRLFMVWWLY